MEAVAVGSPWALSWHGAVLSSSVQALLVPPSDPFCPTCPGPPACWPLPQGKGLVPGDTGTVRSSLVLWPQRH